MKSAHVDTSAVPLPVVTLAHSARDCSLQIGSRTSLCALATAEKKFTRGR